MLSSLTPQKIGAFAEELACQYLSAQGLTLLARNYRRRSGEIDLIMQEGDTLIFIEVRYRKQANFGHCLETICLRKQVKLIKTAQQYLRYAAISPETCCRFDVVAVFPSFKSNPYKNLNTSQHHTTQVEWIKNAFFM